jgi:hypothetical protein
MFPRAALALVAFLFVPAAGARDTVHAQPARLLVLYASDWAGPMEIFAADPSSRSPVRQVTFGRPPGACSWAAACGFSDPMPSPDGRRLAFWSGGLWFQSRTLWLARIDGSGRREVATATAAEWTPDSKLLVYSAADGIHELAMSGVDRRVTRPPGAPVSLPVGLPPDALGWAWSSDRRTFAYATREGIFIGPATVGSPRLVYAFGQGDLSPIPPRPFELAFSANGHLLAATLSSALAILDLRRHRVRLVTGSAHGLGWSPDGRRLLYLQRSDSSDGDSIATGDVRTVTPDGHIRVIVARSAPYGGQIVAAAWAAPPRDVSFKPPEQVDGVFAGGPVQKLAADGDNVAYASCGGVSVWNAATNATSAIQATGSCYAPFSRAGHVATLALADDRVLWWSAYTGLGFSWSMDEATIGSPPVQVATGFGNLGSTPSDGSGTALGAGSLLVMSSWTLRRSDDGTRDVARQTIEQVDPAGCPCTAISTSPGPYTPLDVDQARIVVSSPDKTRVLGSDGTILLSVPVPTLAAQLDGSQLVLATGSELRVYDAQTGALKHSWPLAAGPAGHDCDRYGDPSCDLGQPTPVTLEDVSYGLAAYIDAGQVHLLRLGDGDDNVVGDGTIARFTAAGLAYADGARVRLRPYDQLPLQ